MVYLVVLAKRFESDRFPHAMPCFMYLNAVVSSSVLQTLAPDWLDALFQSFGSDRQNKQSAGPVCGLAVRRSWEPDLRLRVQVEVGLVRPFAYKQLALPPVAKVRDAVAVGVIT